MKFKLFFKNFAFLTALVTALIISGCGGGGSSSDDSDLFTAQLAAGKVSIQNGGTRDTLYACIKGSGAGGGHIEDQAGNELPGSDLVLNSINGNYEVLLDRSSGSFRAGTYVLKYFLNGEVYELKKEQLEWTTVPEFIPAPNPPVYNSSTRTLTVSYQPVNGSRVEYYLSIYSAVTGSLYRETSTTPGTEISEYLSRPGDYQIRLNADVYQNDVLTYTVKHLFTDVIKAGVKAP
ncbi:MAG: hypothetical protein ACQETH_00415 [Candidatus Rifleibacteriota bacterium]